MTLLVLLPPLKFSSWEWQCSLPSQALKLLSQVEYEALSPKPLDHEKTGEIEGNSLQNEPPVINPTTSIGSAPLKKRVPPASNKKNRTAKKEFLKIGGMRGKIGIVMEEDNPLESKEESKEGEETVMETSALSVGAQNTSIISNSGQVEGSPPSASLNDSSIKKEQTLEDLLKLYEECQKSKNVELCAKITSNLESTLNKFKALSTSLASKNEESKSRISDASYHSGNSPEIEGKGPENPPTAPSSSRKKIKKETSKRESRKTIPSTKTTNSRALKSQGSNVRDNQKSSRNSSRVVNSDTKENKIDKKKAEAPVDTSSFNEELKEKVYELYGDDAQYDDIQQQLLKALKDHKRSKSAKPIKGINYKEVVLKLHHKLMEKQRESESEILKRSIDRQRKAQEKREKQSKERQEVINKKKERYQLVKERYAEIEAEKQKQNAENEQKLALADERYEKRINNIKTKARAEGEKVEEVIFVKDAENENKRALIEGKLEESAGRRKSILDHTKQKQIDMIEQRSEMAEKKRLAIMEEQKAKFQLNQQKRDDAEVRRKELLELRKQTAEGDVIKVTTASERKKQLFDEVLDLYNFLCKKENLWEYLEVGLMSMKEEGELDKLRPFERIKRRLMNDHEALNKIMSFDTNGNLIIKRPRLDSLKASFRNSVDEEEGEQSEGDFENPYPEMASHRKNQMNQSCSCVPIITPDENEKDNTGFESDKECESRKMEVKKASKQKGKQRKKAKGTSYSSYKTNVPPQRMKPPPVEPKPTESPGTLIKHKSMCTTPSLPELMRNEPELFKERVILLKDEKTGEFCKNKLVIKLVKTENIESEAPYGTTKFTKSPRQSKSEENKEELALRNSLQTEIIDKMLTLLRSESPLQLNTSNEKLVHWVENKEPSCVYWCNLCQQILFPENDKISEHINREFHIREKDQAGEADLFCAHFLQINTVLTSDSNNELMAEKAKLLKKKAKKIKQSLGVTSVSHESYVHNIKELMSPNKMRIQRLIIDLEKQVFPHIKDYEVVETILKEIVKITDQRVDADLQLLRHLKCIHTLLEICKRVFCCHKNELKSLGRLLEIVMKLLSMFTTLRENRKYLLVTNRLLILVELLFWCLSSINTKYMYGLPFLPTLLQILTVHIKQRVEFEQLKLKEAFIQYIICYGVLNKLKLKVFQIVSGPIDLSEGKNIVPSLLLGSIVFVESLTLCLCIEPALSRAVFDKPSKSSDDAIFVIQQTEIFGTIPLLSKILLSKGPFKESGAIMPYTIHTLVLMSLKILNNCCRIDLNTIQIILKQSQGGLYFSEQMFHFLNYLMQYCIEKMDLSEEVRELLHETIVLMGYVALLDPELQNLFSKGTNTLVQKLCGLPIQYFQEQRMKDILFPTLIAVIHNHERNFSILSQEMDTNLIATYMKNHIAKAEEEATEDHMVSSTSSAFDMLFGNSPFICFFKRIPKSLWEPVITLCGSP